MSALPQSQIANHPIHHSVPASLIAEIDLAREQVADARRAFANRRSRLNGLLARRAEMLDRADKRFTALDDDALEQALGHEGPLDQKLADGMRIVHDADPDPSDDESTDDDQSDQDDTVLSAQAADAQSQLRDYHGSNFDQVMEESFAKDMQTFQRDLSEEEKATFDALLPQSAEAYADDLHENDSGGDA